MKTVFDRIVLAFDDSPASRLALDYACALAREGATLIVAHAVDETGVVASAMTSTGFAAIDPKTLIDAVDAEGESVLQSAVDACAARGVTVERAFVRDAARTGIADLQRRWNADLIVLGTHGRHGVSRALLGSVAEDVLRASSVPVLVLTAHAKSPPAGGAFTRALVAVDDSPPSVRAMELAARLAAGCALQLIVCTVIDPGRNAAPRAVVDAAAALAPAASIDDRVVAEGEPAQTIEHVALQRNCDLIVLGSHVRSGLERLFIGSVAEAVLRTSALPVLVVPDGAPQANS